MTSRERLLTALRCRRPDRVPVTIYEYSPYYDEWPAREPSYAPLLELERTLGDGFVFMPTDMPVFFDPGTIRSHDEPQPDGSLVRTVTADTPGGPLRSVQRRDPGLMTWWQTEPWIKSDADLRRILSLPDPPTEIDADQIRTIAERTGDAGVLCFNPGDAVGRIVGLFDFEDFVLRCHRDMAPIRELLGRAQTQLVRSVRAVGAHLRDAAFRLWGPEYCGAPLMNPRRYFERLVVEPDRELTAAIHATGNFSIIHCHGRLRDLLPLIAEIEADALEPIETLPLATADVTLFDVKAALGERMCLMGAIQAHTLECGTPDDMRREVQAAIRDAAAGGGFVLLPTSAPFMLPLTPRCLANARAMYETAHAHGSYTGAADSPRP